VAIENNNVILMKKRMLIGILLIQFILFSCKKDYDIFVVDNNPRDTVWTIPGSPNQLFAKFLDEIERKPLEETVADIALGGTVNFPGDIQVHISEKSFNGPGGSLASGTAKLELVILNSRGQFIRNCKPTSSNGNPLETSAELLIRIIQNGQELSLIQGKYIFVSYPESNPSNSMLTHYGELAGAGNVYLDWTPTADGSYANTFARPDPLYPGRTITGYDVKIRQLRWVNCGMLTDTLNRSKITATLPDTYTNANTKVFVVFDDIRAVVQMQDNASAKIFFATNIPLSKSVRFISISAINADYYLGVAPGSIGANNNYSIKPQKKTLDEIVEFLNTL